MQTEKYLSSRELMEFVGGVSAMSIWRWENAPALNFPEPRRIGRRKFWRQSEVAEWLDRRANAR